MSKIFAFVIVAAVALQASLAKPSETQLNNLSQNAKQVADDISNTLGLQKLDSEKLVKTISDQSKAVAENLQNIVDKLKAEAKAHQPEVDSLIKSVEEKLAKTASDLKQSLDPKTQKQIEETRQKFDEGVKNAAAEIGKLAKAVQENEHVQAVQTNVKNVAKNALDTFLSTVKDAEVQLKKAIEEHQKSHQH